MKYNFIFITMLSIMLTACINGGVTTVKNKKSFACSFMKLDSISVEQCEHTEFTLNLIYYCDGLYLNWYGYCFDFPKSSSYNEERNVIYEEMNRRHNDESYYKDRDTQIDSYHFPRQNYACFDINTLEVISTEDFDEQHPAGTSLNDMIRFVGITPMPYITSGYINEYDWHTGVLNERIVAELYSQISDYTDGYYWRGFTHLIDKPLIEILPEDLMMLGGDKGTRYDQRSNGLKLTAAFLVFTQKPTKGYKQPLIIKITAFDGIQNVKADIPVEMTF